MRKRILAVLLLSCFSVFAFTACSKDTNKNGSGNKGPTVNPTSAVSPTTAVNPTSALSPTAGAGLTVTPAGTVR